VLAGVLLHVIAAASGVNLAVDAGSGLDVIGWGFKVMDDATVFGVGNLGDFECLVFGQKYAGVKDLPAASGIEGGAVQNYCGALGLEDFFDLGFEIVEERVMVVETLSHGEYLFHHRGILSANVPGM
jgi:hypothetical protein